MFNIISIANEMLNSTPKSCEEIIKEFHCKYEIEKANLPDSDRIIAFTADYPGEDLISISFSDGADTVYIIGDTDWIQDYDDFVQGLSETDKVIVQIRVEKRKSSGYLHIYNLKAFSDFLNSRTYEQIFAIFSELFSVLGEHIVFRLLDKNGSFRTNSIAMSDNCLQWMHSVSRNEQWRRCTGSSVFLSRDRFSVIPQDFAFADPMEGTGFEEIDTLFRKCRNVLSYVFLANTSQIINERAILQFDPTVSPEEYSLEELSENNVVYNIFQWVYKDEGCTERASIARKIINIYCRDREKLLAIGEKVLNSIKSDFQIYQKDHVEKYIDMKNKIAEYIVDSVGKLNELSHEMTEAIKNNLVAIFVFVMTAILTDSIDFEKLIGKDISVNYPLVCGLFTIISFLYLLITVFTGWRKWKWVDNAYKQMKNNYKELLDPEDLEEAFGRDAAHEEAKKHFKLFTWTIAIIWILAILAMGVFTCKLYKNIQMPPSEIPKIEVLLS